MEHFYDGQIKRYLTQFMRLMSNFGYKDAKGKVIQVPVRYGLPRARFLSFHFAAGEIFRKARHAVVRCTAHQF